MSTVEKKKYTELAVESFNPRTAAEEARRCLLCYDAPCSKACPAGTDPAKFIRSVRFNNIKGAAETIRANNPLGGCCAKVCPYDQLCQEACSRSGIDRPIQIGRIQSFVVEQEELFDMHVMGGSNERKDTKVACLGAGPASLTVAAKLAELGYEVTVFEAEENAGGMMTYGIVPARLPKKVVDYDISLIRQLGVKFKFETRVHSIDALKEEGFAAIFVGVGLWGSKMIDIPGCDLNGVFNAVEYLKLARSSNGQFNHKTNVVIIGGGDVAMDCAATAMLTGAKKVMVYYRRTIEEAPADINEIKYIQDMGVTITTEFYPEKITADNGKVRAISFKGRDGESTATVKADTVVFAIGQSPKNVSELADFIFKDNGCINVDEYGNCGIDGVFAAGDIVNGGKTIVAAVEAGKIVANTIAAYLEKKEGAK